MVTGHRHLHPADHKTIVVSHDQGTRIVLAGLVLQQSQQVTFFRNIKTTKTVICTSTPRSMCRRLRCRPTPRTLSAEFFSSCGILAPAALPITKPSAKPGLQKRQVRCVFLHKTKDAIFANSETFEI